MMGMTFIPMPVGEKLGRANPVVFIPNILEGRAKDNHGGQTLKRLAERGGLDWVEAAAIFTAQPHAELRKLPLEEISRIVFEEEKKYLGSGEQTKGQVAAAERKLIVAYLRHMAELRPADANGLRVIASDVEFMFHHNPELNPAPRKAGAA